jgi:H+-translocating NAD(P) transhydrogenase subunit alpha
MRIGVPKEIHANETRVALTPEMVRLLVQDHHDVMIEAGAGAHSFIGDDAFTQAGATVIADAAALYQQSDVIFKVLPPAHYPLAQQSEAEMLREGSAYIGSLDPWTRPDLIETFVRRHICAFAIELVPRIARAQSMDALSSMANIAGYKAVLLATEHLGKVLPLMMTAAGTIPPARFLILGAGVAGLQAIATAKRLGARVEAFDPRPAVKEQVQSLGATFLAMPELQIAETAAGYATEQGASFLAQEQAIIAERLPEVDVVICAAQIFGKRAPQLITASMVQRMRPGTVIVDLAAEEGGNCALTQPDEAIRSNGVTIIGAGNLPATLPVDASRLYAHNVTNLFRHLAQVQGFQQQGDDAIVRATCVTRDGAMVNEVVRAAMPIGGSR